MQRPIDDFFEFVKVLSNQLIPLLTGGALMAMVAAWGFLSGGPHLTSENLVIMFESLIIVTQLELSATPAMPGRMQVRVLDWRTETLRLALLGS